jgi:hypothetical protein
VLPRSRPPPGQATGSPQARPRSEVQRVVVGVVVGRPRKRQDRIDSQELRGRRVIDPRPHVDEARVGAGVLAVVAEGRGGGAFAGGGSVGAVGAFAGDGPGRSGQEPRGARLVVMQVGDGASGVVDLLDGHYA